MILHFAEPDFASDAALIKNQHILIDVNLKFVNNLKTMVNNKLK